MNLFGRQTAALLRRNILMNMRNIIDVMREFIFPMIIVAIIVARKWQIFFADILLPFYMPLIILGLHRKMLLDIVLEKSERFKEMLRIMGMKELPHTVSWLASFYTIGALIEVFALIILCFGGIYDNNDSIGKVLGAFALYLFSSIHMTLCITTLFSSPKSSIKMGSMILGIACLIYFPLAYPDNTPYWLMVVFSFVPQCGLSLTIMNMQPDCRL